MADETSIMAPWCNSNQCTVYWYTSLKLYTIPKKAHEIYYFVEPFLHAAHHYYTFSLSNLCPGVEKIFKI